MRRHSWVLPELGLWTVLRFLFVLLLLCPAGNVRAQELAEALDTTNLTWTTSAWTAQTNITHDGVDAAVCERSEAMTSGGSLQALVNGDVAVAFWWKLSVPVNRGSLEFHVDGVKQTSITGEVDWERRSLLVPTGQHMLMWRFVPDSTYWSGAYQNSAWLDEVGFLDPNTLTFSRELTNQTVLAGESVVMAVQVLGVEPLSFSWFFNGTNLSGAGTPVLTLTNVQASNVGDYFLVVTNQFGSLTSQVATLTVNPRPPEFTLQPLGRAAPWGATVPLTAVAIGSEPITWQWYHNGIPLAGRESASCSITNFQLPGAGDYFAVASNSWGSTTSAVATLSYSPLLVWGDNTYNQQLIPATATNLNTVAGGDAHVLVSLAEGGVVAWGGNYDGQTNVPPDTTNILMVAAGSAHSLGLRNTGNVVQWGRNYGSWTGASNAVSPEATNIVALALGGGAQHALGIREDGSALDWGSFGYGLTNVPPSVTDVVSVAVGAYHAVALRSDGTVVAWGGSGSGIGTGVTNVPVSATNVVAISAGWFHNLALRADGSLVPWGQRENYGQNVVPREATNIARIASGGYHNLALRRDGKLLAWGYNNKGQITVPAWATNIVAVGGTSFGSLALVGEGPARITTQPLPRRTVTAGDSVVLAAEAVGALPLAFQWFQNGVPLPGGTRERYLLSDVQDIGSSPNQEFTLVASNSVGTATSQVAQVVVRPSAPRIAAQPALVTPSITGLRQVRVGVVGSQPLAYQWRCHGTNVSNGATFSGVNSTNLMITNATAGIVAAFSAVVTNGFGAVTSAVLTLNLTESPVLVAEAVDAPDHTWTFSGSGGYYWSLDAGTSHDGMDAAGTGKMNDGGYQGFTTTHEGPTAVYFWWKVSSQTNGDFLNFIINGVTQGRISGEVDWERRSFALPVGTSSLSWQYSKNAKDVAGMDRAWVDEISFSQAVLPVCTVEPTGGRVSEGNSFALAALAVGTEPMSYQWRLGGADLLAMTNAWLTIAAARAEDAGAYDVVVSNLAGAITSHVTRLEVLLRQPWLTTASNGSLQLNWSRGKLETAEHVDGPWQEIENAMSPVAVQPTGFSRFYRVRQ